ncbi:MAG: acyltransferase [Methylacidiphilales bacterium]|nr:acyltransferase [Candidatus Methylacidiphilales bacterium]
MNVGFSRRSPTLPWLTVLRYPAALWVVLLHACNGWITETNVDPVLKLFVERGYLGVSFFFILSGFILAYNYPEVTSPRAYYLARAGRILPVYYLSLLFSLPLLAPVLQQNNAAEVTPILLAILTLTQAWIPSISSAWNGPAWTLSCEAFFYFTFPMLLVPLTEWCRGMGRTLMLLALCLGLGLILPILFTWTYGTGSYTEIAYSAQGDQMQTVKLILERFPLVRLVEFIAGMVLCLGVRAHLHRLSESVALLMVIFGVAWVGSSLWIPFIFSMGTFCLPGFALIIVGAATLPFPVEGGIRSWLGRAGLLLGNASYAVYLFHAPVLRYLAILDPEVFIRPDKVTVGFIWGWFLAAAVIITLLSISIHLLFEEPARRWIRQGIPVFSRPVP